MAIDPLFGDYDAQDLDPSYRRNRAIEAELEDIFRDAEEPEDDGFLASDDPRRRKSKGFRQDYLIPGAKAVGNLAVNAVSLPAQTLASVLQGARDKGVKGAARGLVDPTAELFGSLGQEVTPEGQEDLTSLGAKGFKETFGPMIDYAAEGMGRKRDLVREAALEEATGKRANTFGEDIAEGVGTVTGTMADPLAFLDAAELPAVRAAKAAEEATRNAAKAVRAYEAVARSGARVTPRMKAAAMAAYEAVAKYSPGEAAGVLKQLKDADTLSRARTGGVGSDTFGAVDDVYDWDQSVTHADEIARTQASSAKAREAVEAKDALRAEQARADAARLADEVEAKSVVEGVEGDVVRKDQSLTDSLMDDLYAQDDIPAAELSARQDEIDQALASADDQAEAAALQAAEDEARARKLMSPAQRAMSKGGRERAAKRAAAQDEAARVAKSSVWDDMLGPEPEARPTPEMDIDVLPAEPERVTHVPPSGTINPPAKPPVPKAVRKDADKILAEMIGGEKPTSAGAIDLPTDSRYQANVRAGDLAEGEMFRAFGEQYEVVGNLEGQRVVKGPGGEMTLAPDSVIPIDEGTRVSAAEVAENTAREKAAMAGDTGQEVANVSARVKDLIDSVAPSGLRRDLTAQQKKSLKRLLQTTKGDALSITRQLAPYFEQSYVRKNAAGKIVGIKGLQEYLDNVPGWLRSLDTYTRPDQAAQTLFDAGMIADAHENDLGEFLRNLTPPGKMSPEGASYAPVGGVSEQARGATTLRQATTPAATAARGKPMNAKELTKFLAQITNTAVSDKGLGAGSLGVYRNFTGDVIAKDPGIIFHEVAHRLEDIVFQGGSKDLLTGEAFKPWKHELDALAQGLQVGKRSSTTSEGFAEGVRLWLSDPTSLAAKAPDFMRDFHGIVNAQDPKLAANLVALQREILAFEAATDEAKIIANFVSHAGKSAPVNMTMAEKIGHALIDDLIPLRKAELQIYGKNVEPVNLPSVMIERARHMPAQTEAFYFEGVPDPHTPGKFMAPSLHEVAVAAGDNDKLGAYVYASRVLQRYDAAIAAKRPFKVPVAMLTTRMPGASAQDQAQVIARLRDVVQNADPKVVAAAQGPLKSHTQAIPTWLNERGLVSHDMMKKWQAANPTYLPMNRAGESAGDFMARAALESEKSILDPMAQHAANLARLGPMAARNDVMLTMVKMANEKKDIGNFVRIMPGQVVQYRNIERVEQAAKAVGMTVDDYALANNMSKEDLAKVMADFSGDYDVALERGQFRARNYKNSKGVRPYQNIDADEIVFEVRDPNVAQVLHNVGNDNFADELSLDMLSALSVPARAFRYGTTGNIGFGVKNFLTDVLTSGVTSRTQNVPFIDAVYNAFSGIKSVVNKDEFYRIAREAGSFIEGLPEGNVAKVNTRMLQDAISTKGKTAVQKATWGLLEDWSAGLERATRTGEVKAMIKANGWDASNLAPWQMARLGQAGREVTTDFLRAGAYMKGLNSVSPFVNANVQGAYGFWQGVKRRPGNAAVQASALIGASALFWFANSDQKWYKDLSQESRDKWWHVRAGGRTWRIPKPQGPSALFANWTEKMLDGVSEKRPWAAREAVGSALGVVDGMIPLLTNPMVKFIVERGTGAQLDMTRFSSGERGQSIVPQALQKGAPHEQMYPDQGATSVAVTKGLSALGVEMSPIEAERHARTFGGTLASGVLSTTDTLASLFGSELPAQDDRLRGLPVVGRFIEREHPTRTDPGDAVHDAYTAGRQASESLALRSGEDQARFAKDHEAELRRYEMARGLVANDAELQRAIMLIRKSKLSPREKLDKINRILDQKADMMRQGAEALFAGGK